MSFDVEDALQLATFAAPAWGDDGRRVGYLRFRGGDTSFVAREVPSVEETDLSLDAPTDDAVELDDVSAFAWRPSHPEEAAVVRDGDPGLFDAATGKFERLVAAGKAHESPAWHPDGSRLAYVRDDVLWEHDVDRGTARAISEAPVAERFDAPPVEWSGDGRYLATLTDPDDGTLALTVYEPDLVGEPTDADESSPVAWERSPEHAEAVVADAFEWAGDRLVYTEDATDGTDRAYRVVRPGEAAGPGDAGGSGTVVLSERDHRGLAAATVVGHERGRLAVVSPTTGHYHVYVVDLDRRLDGVVDSTGAAQAEGNDPRPGFEGEGVEQLTSGPFEARGDANDAPAWDGDGSRLAYVTNEHDAGERRLHVASLDADGSATDVRAFEDVEGNVVNPTWAEGTDRAGADGTDRIACLRAGRATPADIHVFDVETGAARRVSASHPDPGVFEAFPEPEPVSFESSEDGVEVRGYLYAPRDADPGDGRPAVVWAHGGPVRQMRRGFHHMRSYGTFHGFDAALVERGYVVLELNYRGGIGYGRDYEKGIHHAVGRTDVADCVDAATFLRSHDLVGDRVGFWGLSYGGYLANAVATGTDAFDCAVNFAGVWDWREWVRYATSGNWGAGRRFTPLFGGHPDDDDPSVAERYERASPADSAESLAAPLFALHGTEDPNVPFEHMDGLVETLVEGGSDFEMAYYPGEDHMFERPATWRDALGRVLPFFEEHLRDEPGATG